MPPVPFTLNQAQFDDLKVMLATGLREVAEGVSVKAREAATVVLRSEQFQELQKMLTALSADFTSAKKEQLSVIDAALEAQIDNCVNALEATAKDFEKRIGGMVGRVETVIIENLSLVVGKVKELSTARVTLDDRAVVELMTHARHHLHKAIEESKEHMAHYLVDDFRKGVGPALREELKLAAAEGGGGGVSGFLKFCIVLTTALLAAMVGAIGWSVYRFKPPVLDFGFDKDGKFVPSPDTARAIQNHSFSVARN